MDGSGGREGMEKSRDSEATLVSECSELIDADCR